MKTQSRRIAQASNTTTHSRIPNEDRSRSAQQSAPGLSHQTAPTPILRTRGARVRLWPLTPACWAVRMSMAAAPATLAAGQIPTGHLGLGCWCVGFSASCIVVPRYICIGCWSAKIREAKA